VSFIRRRGVLGALDGPRNTAAFPPAPVVTVPCQIMSMSKLDDIIIPGLEIEADPDATALWNQTGNFIGNRLGTDGTRQGVTLSCSAGSSRSYATPTVQRTRAG